MTCKPASLARISLRHRSRCPPARYLRIAGTLALMACGGSDKPRVLDVHRVPLRSDARAADGHRIAVDEAIVGPGRGRIRVEGSIPVSGYCPEVSPTVARSGSGLLVHVEVRPAQASADPGGGPGCPEPSIVSGVAYTFAIAGVLRGTIDVELHHRAAGPGSSEPGAGTAPDHRSMRRVPVVVE